MTKKLLPESEQRDLAKKAQSGDVVARNKLMVANQGLVGRVAKRFWNRDGEAGACHDELMSEGQFGLIRAIQKFDTAGPTYFATFATRGIWMAIRDAKRDDARRRLHYIDSDDFSDVPQRVTTQQEMLDGEEFKLAVLGMANRLGFNQRQQRIVNLMLEQRFATGAAAIELGGNREAIYQAAEKIRNRLKQPIEDYLGRSLAS